MRTILAALLLLAPAAASAHEIWVERDATGPARIYLGEPAEPMPAGGDPEFAKLRAPKVLGRPNTTLIRRAGFIETAVPAGDVRIWDDAVFALWGDPGKREGVVFYARAGRAEPSARLPFEIAPATRNGGRFIVIRDGKPVPDTEVTLIAPDRTERKLRTDAAGSVEVVPLAPGRHLLVAARKEGAATLPGGDVQTVHRITTTSFVAGR